MAHDDLALTRREFLKTGGGALAVSLAVGTGALSASRTASAEPMRALGDADARTLLVMSRTLFPYDSLADSYYLAAVKGVDGKAAADEKTRRLVSEGIAGLNGARGKPFADLPEQERVGVLKTMETSDFFQLVYGETINGVFGNHDVWKRFGYQGSSVEYGGYLHRGFDDINWLPKHC